ncbi:MAG: GNAT family N-acetyltransferase [Planctomycetota bacterium]
MNPPPLHLRLATLEDRPALQDLYTQHLQFLASFNPSVQADAPLQDLWFERPGVLFPWLLKTQTTLLGFALLGGRKLSEAMGSDTDFYLHEFHMAEPFRGQGFGRKAVHELLKEHPGSWSVDVHPANPGALRFWEVALASVELKQTDYFTEEGVRFIRHMTRSPR